MGLLESKLTDRSETLGLDELVYSGGAKRGLSWSAVCTGSDRDTG